MVQRVAVACAHLEEALCVLKDAGQPPLNAGLEQQIRDALADLKPDCTLEHLKVSSCIFQRERFYLKDALLPDWSKEL